MRPKCFHWMFLKNGEHKIESNKPVYFTRFLIGPHWGQFIPNFAPVFLQWFHVYGQEVQKFFWFSFSMFPYGSIVIHTSVLAWYVVLMCVVIFLRWVVSLCMVRKPPDCHHESRVPHKCHAGQCPPCQQQCNLVLEACGHKCHAPCHSAVLCRPDNGNAPRYAGPWEIRHSQSNNWQLVAKPCPPCTTPVIVSCLGRHEVSRVVNFAKFWLCLLEGFQGLVCNLIIMS
jgi:hypothetical protein